MNNKDYIEAQISTLERLSKTRPLTSCELHDLAIMKNQLKEYDH